MTATALERRTLSFRALDYRFDVSGDDDELLARVAACYRDLAAEPAGAREAPARYELLAGSSDDRVRLTCDGTPVFGESARSHALGVLLWHVNAQATQRAMPGHVVLHAAAATRGGRALVLAAPMESGKTTTVSGLVRAGFGYLTDEAAAVCLADGHVEPFPKSLAIDSGSWHVLDALADHDVGGMATQWQVPVSSLPQGHLAERTPLSVVVLPKYTRGSETVLEPVSRAAAVLSLAASTFQFLDAPERNLDALADVVAGADCYRLTIGSLERAVTVIDDLMGDR